MTIKPQIFLLAGLLLVACRKDLDHYDQEELSGGYNGTVFLTSSGAFSQQMPGIGADKELQFFVGNSFFNQNWVSAPSSTTARDGLGPLFNARSCSACHFQDGRGEPVQDLGDNSNGFLLRLSVPGEGVHGEPLPDPVYGPQFNDLAVSNALDEGDIFVTYEYISGTYEDGTPYELRKPFYYVSNLNYGSIASNVMMSPRIGQQMIGLGLLEAIDEQDILALADEADVDGDGISGKPNYVWDFQSESEKMGRFGWKSGHPSVMQQVAGALIGDLGIKSNLFDTENHSAAQSNLDTLPDGGIVEIEEDDFGKLVLYCSSLAVPARRNVDDESVVRGRELFRSLDCAKCHTVAFNTGNSHYLSYLNNQTIHPYSDLLLHDMGPGLADNRPDFKANGQEWRTQPLWGIGLISIVNGHTFFLHDGRARSLEEAILWHGGEAENAKNQFKSLESSDRQALIDYLNSL
ncbi:c-type cytochrome [Paracrocinitomix mangrovi]|uniref:di-heme oxidoreductase family protein n=1 Tax=Paracrocinitomix mangrovi TaxID=2862509 RepID=UPI001C8D04D0|nr:di-heme oxidoredictase family protein [Paracrocinitomix mangrovi]UKN02193.1 c-type cytochrome [Paracrocinitomix mangrovi]